MTLRSEHEPVGKEPAGAMRQQAAPGDGFDIDALLEFFRRHWRLVASLAFLGAVIGYGCSHLMTKLYSAEVLLAPVSDAGGQSPLKALASRVGALANIAGLDGDAAGYSTPMVIAMLKSRDFLEDFIERNKLLPVLFSKQWDAQKAAWKQADPRKVPTLEGGYDYFQRRILSVNEDRRSGLITLRVEWRDRVEAAEWANSLVASINDQTRARAIQDADLSLKYLGKELENAQSVELRQSIYSLIETQMNRRMLASTRPDFAFRVIDRAQPSDPRKYVSPRRIRVAAFGVLSGALLGIAIALARLRRRS